MRPEAESSSGARPERPRASARPEPAALFALALLSVLWGWWAWQEGAYFGVVLLPGAIVLCLGVALLTVAAPVRFDLRLSRPAAVALAATAALAGWAALSALWSPAPDVAIVDGQRIAVYAIAFAVGLWLCNLLGPRMHLALVPVAAGAGFAGVMTMIGLLTGDTPREYLEIDGTLDYPLGYRNATAAFFAIALFPAVGLAADRRLDWRARAVALAVATLCVDVFLLCQSRASAPAMIVALVVFAWLSPLRLRALSWLALAALPAIGMVPAFASLYDAAREVGVGNVVSQMHTAGAVAVATTGLSLLLGAAAARLEGRLPGLGSSSGASNRAVARVLAAVAAVAVVGFLAAVGDPIKWLGDRADEFRSSGTPEQLGESSRFSLNAGSDRYDLWRVAIGEAGSDPLFGTGAGGYGYAYLRERDVDYQNARDAHSVEFEVLSELGLPGLAMLLTALGAAAVGAARSRRLGPSAAGLSAIVLSSGAYWLVHSSVDWFWPYPAVTAPVFALFGAACAPAALALSERGSRRARRLLVTGLAFFALLAVPPFLSERYVNSAFETWPTDAERAYEDLDRARALNRLSDAPLLAEGAIARAAADRPRALAAFREAAEKRPEEWATHYLLAELQASEDRLVARNELLLALELNPLSDRARALARQLGLGGVVAAPDTEPD